MTHYNVLVQSHLFDAVAEKATDGASHRSFSLYTICALLLTSIGYAGAAAFLDSFKILIIYTGRNMLKFESCLIYWYR